MTGFPGFDVAEQLYAGPQTAVFRGRRRADGVPVVLKGISGESATLSQFARWSHEFDLLRRISSGRVPKAHGLAVVENRPVLVIEDIGGTALRELAGTRAMDIGAFLDVAIEAAHALAEIHASGVVHMDVNPSNIVWNAATGRAQLIDFGGASVLSRETRKIVHPNVLEGTLAYVSPEQTGRMNRAVDYRTDLYSLGVTFYELITGSLPFTTRDLMELVHSHLARPAIPPHEVAPQVPVMLSRIVMRLLAKTAEERYQSAAGLAADLERCREGWRIERAIPEFSLGASDFADGLRVAQKIYGREVEIRTLLEAFDRVGQGGRELLLVAGYSGVGKSVLVHELHKPLAGRRGFFVSGKFDQYQRNVPYSAVIQAFSELVRQILTESAEEVTRWKDAILGAVGSNGRVIIDVIPQVELIVGPQPELPELAPTEAQNRFHLAFRNFVRVFARRTHPLVVFLDDLQWADGPTLELLESLVTDVDVDALLVIGAYRDNQVDATHPLMMALDALRRKSARLQTCTLAPLSEAHLTELVDDTFDCGRERARSLAVVLRAKTGGNPFFVNQLLTTLHDRGLIVRDRARREWTWNPDDLAKVAVTDNVADLMASRIRTLPERTQQALQLAACIGNRFDLETLAIVHERSPLETGEDLWEAVAMGLLLPVGNSYKELEGIRLQRTHDPAAEPGSLAHVGYSFLHDQIQQAAYSLIGGERRQAVHLAIGRLLLRNIPESERLDRIFDIANQFNFGAELLRDPKEREEVARVNLAAGQRARASAAYQSAASYLQTGLSLLAEDRWASQYELALDVYLEAAESAYLSTDFPTVEKHVAEVLVNARTLLDKVRAYEVKILALISQRKLPDALYTGVSVLALLGEDFPTAPTGDDVGAELGRTAQAIAGRSTDELQALPPMTDPEKLAAMMLLERITSAAYQSMPIYLPLFICRQVQLSAKYGNAASSPYGYATYGLIVCGVLGDIDVGYGFGTLALALQASLPEQSRKCRVFHMTYTFTRIWKDPVRSVLQPLLEGYRSGMDTGDFEYASYASLLHGYYGLFGGAELKAVDEEMAAFAHSAVQTRQELTSRYFHIWRQVVHNLMGDAADPAVLKGEFIDAEVARPFHAATNDGTGVFFILFNQLVLQYHFGRLEEAALKAAEVEQRLDAVTALMTIPLFYMYDSLVALARFGKVPEAEREALLKKVEGNQQKVDNWANHAPANYRHRHTIVEAERARVAGDGRAVRLYEDAITQARESQVIQDEALACELAGEYHLASGVPRVAHAYLADARLLYARWGAMAKVHELDARHPQLVARVTARAHVSRTATDALNERAFDLGSIVKASQAISQDLMLDALVPRLLKIALENAGANRGVLMLAEHGKLRAAAEITPGQPEATLLAADREHAGAVPASVVNLVARTLEPLVITDAARPEQFARDPYFETVRPRSLLCLPLVHQGRLAGLAYFENTLANDAFTEQRLEVLTLLSSQMAISITNARLYRDLELATVEVRRKESQLRQFLDAVPVGVFVADAAGTPYYANHKALDLLGRGLDPTAKSDVLAERYQVYRAGTDELYPTGTMPLVRALAGTPTSIDDMEVHRPDRHVLLGVSGAPIFDDSGSISYAVAVFQDITERKKAQQLLEDYNRTLEVAVRERTLVAASAQQAAEAANQAKSTFLANMSHEIRTPLTALLGFADLLADPRVNESERLNYALTIRRNSEHLLRLINDILDLSKIEAGKLTLERTDTSLEQVLADVTLLMANRAREKGLSFEVEVATPVPAVFECDPTRLRQILLNLAGNAVKFTAVGSVRLVLRETFAAGAPMLDIDVIDTGIGMSGAQLAHLFQAFHQADTTTTRRFGGTGLGLAICKRLALALGGDITTRSEPGQGSTFTLTVPLVGRREGLLRAAPGLQMTKTAIAPHPHELLDGTVLLAEDGYDNQVLISTILRKRGVHVTLAENGELAVEHAMKAMKAGTPFDLILMDVQMPLLDGYEASARLRANGYRRPIVALTAHAMAGERERCLAAGCDDYMSKPIDRGALIELVRRHLAAPAGRRHGPPLFSLYEGDAELGEVVARFVSAMPERIAELREAARRAETGALHQLAHQLKGAAGGYGFPDISEAADRVERSLRSGAQIAAVASELDGLLELCARASAGAGAAA